MRQFLNVSYAAQAGTKKDQAELDRWELELNRPPAGYFRQRHTRRRSMVAPGLDALMPATEALS